MPQRVVVVGGGVVGLWCALHLRRASCEVVVLERGELGEGATAKATGGLRTQFSHRANIDLAVRSLEQWEGFGRTTGAELAFRRHGYLFLHDDPAAMAGVAGGLERLRDLGVGAHELDPGDIDTVFPGVRTDDLVGATYTPTDGSASPADAVLGLAACLRRSGVDVRRRTTFLDVRRHGDGSVAGVVTDSGDVAADHVVVATGPQAVATGATCGVDIPIRTHPRQAFAVQAEAGLSPGLPLTIDMASGVYLHPESAHTGVIGGGDRDVPAQDEPGVDWERLESVAEVVTHRFPALEGLEVTGGWSGLREMTPDDRPVIGPGTTDVPGLWLAVGFSGHGFSQAPAAGELVADLVCGTPPGLDPAPFTLARFDAGEEAAPESAVF